MDLLLEPINPIAMDPATLDTLTNPFDLLTSADTMHYTMLFEIPDSANTDSISILLGTSNGGSQLGSWFIEMPPASAPTGTQWSMIGNTVYFKVEDLLFNDPVYFEVFLKNSSGSSTTVKFNTL